MSVGAGKPYGSKTVGSQHADFRDLASINLRWNHPVTVGETFVDVVDRNLATQLDHQETQVACATRSAHNQYI
jgi:hypothetical protein